MTRLTYLLVIAISISTSGAIMLCSHDEFECKSKTSQYSTICISKNDVCNGEVDCYDGDDEVECNVYGVCGLYQLQCDYSKNNSECISDVCTGISLGLNGKCESKRDKIMCGCLNEQVRCPLDGMCYNYKNAKEFCAKCNDPNICNQDSDDHASKAKECGETVGYFSCKPDPFTDFCLPMSAMCDGYMNCYLGDDNKTCSSAKIKNNGENLLEVYLDDNVTVTYTVTGWPKPYVEMFQFGKPLSLPVSLKNGSKIEHTLTETGEAQYELKVVFTKMRIEMTGMFTMRVMNTWMREDANEAGLSLNSSYVLYLDLQGKPTADFSWDLPENKIVGLNDTITFTCVTTAFPVPSIVFMYENDDDDNSIELKPGEKTKSVLGFTMSRSDNETTKTSTATLTFKPTYGLDDSKFGCGASNIIDSVPAEESTKFWVLDKAAIQKFELNKEATNDADYVIQDNTIYAKTDAPIYLTCQATGFPFPRVVVNLNDTVLAPAVNKSDTYVITWDINAIAEIDCTATNPRDSSVDTAQLDVTFVGPVSVSVDNTGIIETDENLNVKLFFVSFNASRSYMVKKLNKTSGEYVEIDDQEWQIEELTNTFAAISADMKPKGSKSHAKHSGEYQLSAENIFYSASRTFTINVYEAITFTQDGALKDQMLGVGYRGALSVTVVGNPSDVTYQWKKDNVNIGSNSNEYTPDSGEWSKADSGIYSVVATQAETGATITTQANITVIVDPCLLKPCKNNGTCKVRTTQNDHGDMYDCECSKGYQGKDCMDSLWCTKDFMDANPQEVCITTNGNCTATSFELGHFNCSCEFGYNGSRCEGMIKFCEGDGSDTPRCGEGNVCQELLEKGVPKKPGYKCFCRNGKGGYDCELDTLCTPNPCLSNSMCVVEGKGDNRNQYCECASGYMGDVCDQIKKGWCFEMCGGGMERAECYKYKDGVLPKEPESCICKYPFFDDDCSNEITEEVKHNISSHGMLLTRANPLLGDMVTQRIVLPVLLTGDMTFSPSAATSYHIMTLSSNATNDNITVHLEAQEVVDPSDSKKKINQCTLTLLSSCGGEKDASVDITSVAMDPLTLTVVVQNTRLMLEVEVHGHNIRKVAAIDLDEECSNLGIQSFGFLGDVEDETLPGVGLVGWGKIEIGESWVTPLIVAEGRAVAATLPCGVNLCLNDGLCQSSGMVESCNCTDEFNGTYCENKIPIHAEDVTCVNGGFYKNGYCNCPFEYYGVLCEQHQGFIGNVTTVGEESYVTFTSSEPVTQVEAEVVGTYNKETSYGDLVVLGHGSNEIRLRLQSNKLYVIVSRGGKVGVYDGLTATPDTLLSCTDHENPSCIAAFKIIIVADQIVVEISDPNSDLETYVIRKSELPSPDGLPPIYSVKVASSHADVVAIYRQVKINNKEALATYLPFFGLNAYTSDYKENFCESMCYDRGCEAMGTRVRCKNCGSGRDPITCRPLDEINCDKDSCNGTCSPLVKGCICPLGKSGDNCKEETAREFSRYVIPQIQSDYYSYLSFETGTGMGYGFSFRTIFKRSSANLVGTVMFAESSTDENQHVSAAFVSSDKLKVVAQCSKDMGLEQVLPVEETLKWHDLKVEFNQTKLIVTLDDKKSEVEGTMYCKWSLTDLHIGGRPAGQMRSLKASFAHISFGGYTQTQPVDGMNVGVSTEDVCELPQEINKCHLQNTQECKVDPNTKQPNCTCKDGFKGETCSEVKDKCDSLVCPESSECFRGQCLCSYNMIHNSTANDEPICEETFNKETMIGMKCVSNGFMRVPIRYPSMHENGLSLSYVVKKPTDVADGRYHLMTLNVTVGSRLRYITLMVNVNNTEFAKHDLIISGLKDQDSESQIDPGWNNVYIQMAGSRLLINARYLQENTSYNVYPAYINDFYFGATADLEAYTGCLANIMVNNQPPSEISTSSRGLQSCSEEVIADSSDNNFGSSQLWALFDLFQLDG